MLSSFTGLALAGVDRPTDDELEMISKCYSFGVPPQNTTGLPALVIAAWRFYLSDMTDWRANHPSIFDEEGKSLTMLSDLAFKSFEVFEIESR